MRLCFLTLCSVLTLICVSDTYSKNFDGSKESRLKIVKKENAGAEGLSDKLDLFLKAIQNNPNWTKSEILNIEQNLEKIRNEIIKLKKQKQISQNVQGIEELEESVVKKESAQAEVISKKIKESEDAYVVDNKVFLEDWMTTYYHFIKDKMFKDIIIPGTHDSGTGVISEDNAVLSKDGRVPSVNALQMVASKLVPWSKTQDLTIKEQLMIGVRYFDFRVSMEEDGEFYLAHGLRGEKLSDALESISAFCTKYPKELVMIKVKGLDRKSSEKKSKGLMKKLFSKKSSKVSASSYELDNNNFMIEEFRENLSDLLVSRDQLKDALPLTKYSDLIEKGRVIVFFDIRSMKDESKAHVQQIFEQTPWLFDMNNLISSWVNTVSASDLTKQAITLGKKADPNKLYVLQWTLTANASYIAKHLGDKFGIRYMTSKLNGGKLYKDSYTIKDVIAQIPRVNIVQQDFINKDKTSYLIRLNFEKKEKTPVVSKKVINILKKVYKGGQNKVSPE